MCFPVPPPTSDAGPSPAVVADYSSSVDHGEDHQFIDVTEDLQMIVVFAPPDLPDEE